MHLSNKSFPKHMKQKQNNWERDKSAIINGNVITFSLILIKRKRKSVRM